MVPASIHIHVVESFLTGQQETISFKNVFAQATLFTFLLIITFLVKFSESIASRRTTGTNIRFKFPKFDKDKKCRLGKLCLMEHTFGHVFWKKL